MKRILLVEPPYQNKYPPLGLMKLSAYHKLRGDYVKFVKGYNYSVRKEKWDRVYISTLFTFYWDVTIKTIKYYYDSVPSRSDVIVGGVMATLLGNDIENETGVRVVRGLLNKPGILDTKDRHHIDALIPDYKMLDDIEYKYPLQDSYIAYATRGCPNRCGFCAVNTIEPEFVHYIPIKKQIIGIDELYGPKRNLILMDNNVLASDKFEKIIDDILDLGYYRGAKIGNRMRTIDFNQGTDANYLTPNKMSLLAKTAIKPLRIAFDNISLKNTYVDKIKLARDNGIVNLSNYVLYNYKDTPEDFYDRLRINCQLNLELGTQIYSFPMKYMPLTAKDRSFVGQNWNKKLLRGVQCILLATRGLVTTKLDFFEAAFGATPEEFRTIAMMPEHYIIQRKKYKNNGAGEWQKVYESLTNNDKLNLSVALQSNSTIMETMKRSRSLKLKKLLSHYLDENGKTVKV